MNAHQEAVAYLTKQFSLPQLQDLQDWEIQVSDPERVGEFIDFLDAKGATLPPSVRYTLMSLILFSYDEFLSDMADDQEDDYWERILDLLDEEPELYHNALTYWAMWEEYGTKRDDPFAITPLVRQYIVSRKRPRSYLEQ